MNKSIVNYAKYFVSITINTIDQNICTDFSEKVISNRIDYYIDSIQFV